ncbi:unnamed protein product [Thlaspi arvense]|uniref:F-box associated beta-propeller type 1 domain-containing protein n=1 Tax=Thlaspi arvense TaxID=13288 RepID=A0AAU9R4S7_THLAR|nr:unnamed protein product [Thlaspi arvense]
MGFEEDDRKTFSIIGEAGGYFREINLGKRQDIHSRARVCSYVPSLAQIRQPAAGGKRKQQSDVEKHQYDQNISKIIDFQKRFKYW